VFRDGTTPNDNFHVAATNSTATLVQQEVHQVNIVVAGEAVLLSSVD